MKKIKGIKALIRHLKEMKDVIYDQDWLKTANPDLELYYMYRGIKTKDNLRYDITVIPPKILGKEFVKTKGHKHNPHEIYIVLEGEAIFLAQKTKNKTVEDVFAIKAKKNNTIIIPSNYSHITINPSNQELKLGNYIDKDCKNDYTPIKKMKGACYFYTKSGWIKNKNYKKIPELKFKKT